MFRFTRVLIGVFTQEIRIFRIGQRRELEIKSVNAKITIHYLQT